MLIEKMYKSFAWGLLGVCSGHVIMDIYMIPRNAYFRKVVLFVVGLGGLIKGYTNKDIISLAFEN